MNQVNITINPTTRCTLNCIYCHAPQTNHRTLSFKQLQNGLDFIFNKLPDIDKWNLHFNSHDVLLCWDDLIKPCIEQYNSNSVSFSLHTNGILLSEQKAKFLQENNVYLMMSIDGPQYVHDINRKFKNGKSSFDFVSKKLNMLNNINYPISLVATFNELSINYIYDSYQYFINQDNLFTFLFDIKYSIYNKSDLKKLFNQIAKDFAKQPIEKQKLFRLYYKSLNPDINLAYKFTINPHVINSMVNKHSFKNIGKFYGENIYSNDQSEILKSPQGYKCAHNKISCLKCPAFNRIVSNFPKYNMEIYCLFLQELFSEIKKEKGESYFDRS